MLCSICKSNQCAITAAENGNFDILKASLFDCNQSESSNESSSQQDTLLEENKNTTDNLGIRELKINLGPQPCNFDACTELNETVFHLVLKRPLIQKLLRNKQAKGVDPVNPVDWDRLKKEAEALDEKYQKCIEVLLNDDDKINHDKIRRIINIKDRPYGNTALHYAAHNWSDKVILRILSFGGNLSVKNKDGQNPLSRIKADTLKTFLDENCMIPAGKEIEFRVFSNDKSQRILLDEKENELLSGYRINRLLNKKSSVEPMDDVPVQFKFGFLAPAITKPTLKGSTDKINSKLVSREMDVLKSICKSNVHNELITHPVLKAYTWIKWRLVSKVYNRALRIHILLAMCLTWAIFDKFGGRKWKHIGVYGGKNVSESFNHYQCYDEDLYVNKSLGLFHSLNFWRPQEEFGDRVDDMYIVFALHALGQFLCIVFDIIDTLGMRSHSANDIETGKFFSGGRMLSVLYQSFYDIITILLIVVVLLGSREILWAVIIILALIELSREILQMLASIKKYFSQADNYYDLFLLSMIFLLIFVRSKTVSDTLRILGYGWCGVSIDNFYTCNPTVQEEAEKKCMIKRGLAAFTIVIMWIRVFTKIALHPKLDKLNLYMSMFRQVQNTFLEFLFYYSVYIISFGLGFYIMLHQDTEIDWGAVGAKKTSENATETKGDTFRSPWYSFLKTVMMFLGELDYGSFIERIEGGNISKLLSCMFFLFFVFMLNMVLLNLLNAMAISDTEKIIKRSKIYCEMSTIQTISYIELVVFNNLRSLQSVSTLFSCPFPIENVLQSSGTMFFQSAYLDETRLNLKLPLTCGEYLIKKKGFTNRKIEKLLSWTNDDECDEILEEARKILETNTKKQLKKEKKKMKRFTKRFVKRSFNAPPSGSSDSSSSSNSD